MTDFRTEVREALAARLAPRDPNRPVMVMGGGNDDLEPGRRYLAALADGGWAVPTWPVELGGMGASPEQAVVVAQELARFEAPDLYPFGVGLSLVGPTLLTHGTPEQNRRWLPPIGSGAEIWCQLFSEPAAGSDLAGLTCRARRDGDEWRVTGQKVWSSRAHYSEWGLLLARTDPSVPKHAGITCFGLRMAQPGVEVRPLAQMNGDTHFNEVFLDGAVIPDGDRIGDVDNGWSVAVTTLMYERASIGGGGAGAGGIRRDQLLDLARRQGATADPLVRQRLADAVAQLELGRMTAQRARAASERGRAPGPEGSGAKIRLGTTVKGIADLAVDLLGPAGVTGEGEWQTLFLTAPSISIRGGTDEIQRNIVGERVLGLPGEPRVDKGVPFDDVPHN